MGHVIISGGSRMTAPIAGTQAGDLAVGTVVKLNEGGTNVDFLVVNQSIPSNSSLYDASCDGTWLLRKDIYSSRVWNSSNDNVYETSAINTYLNEDYFNTLGSMEQKVIKQVKLPYRKNGGSGGTDQSGANGLSCKVFLLSGYELGWTTSNNQYFPVDGAKLAYFESGNVTSANDKRIAYLNGSAAYWWLRSPYTRNTDYVWRVYANGDYYYYDASYSYGIRPALILPKTAIFDSDTLVLKGG